MSSHGFADSEAHQADTQRISQSSPALTAQSRASSRAANYNHHGEEHSAVARHVGTSGIESTYSFVSPPESARAEESEAEGSVGGGKKFHFPKIKLSLTASPPKPKPKKQPRTPQSAVCIPRFFPVSFLVATPESHTLSLLWQVFSFGRGGLGNFSASSNISPPTPTTASRHKSSST